MWIEGSETYFMKGLRLQIEKRLVERRKLFPYFKTVTAQFLSYTSFSTSLYFLNNMRKVVRTNFHILEYFPSPFTSSIPFHIYL